MDRSNNMVTAEATIFAVDLETARARASRAFTRFFGDAPFEIVFEEATTHSTVLRYDLWRCEFKAEAPS